MSNYFDEHDCEPLRDGEQPNHALHMARLLRDTGVWEQEQRDFVRSVGFRGRAAPPASKEFVKNLPQEKIANLSGSDQSCSICLKSYDRDSVVTVLPCKHHFHPGCLMPWLEHTNSCPMCRVQFPTDDKEYEEMRKSFEAEKKQEERVQVLHDSMFS